MAGPMVGDSPPLVPSDESAATTGPPTNGSSTPMYPQHLGHGAYGAAGALPVPTHHSVRNSHDEGSRSPQAKRIPSIDRLRAQSRGDGSVGTSGRPGDMTGVGTGPLVAGAQPYAAAATGVGSSAMGPNEFGGISGSSTPPSPTRSANMTPRSTHSGSFSHHLARPGSMHSLTSRTGSNYIHIGPAGGAPHQGRPIRLAMPTLLSDSSRDLYSQQQPAYYTHGHSASLGRRPNSIGGDLDALRFASQADGRYPSPAARFSGMDVQGPSEFGVDGRDRMTSMPSHNRTPSSPIRVNPYRHSMGPVSPPRQQSYQAQPQMAPSSPRSPTGLRRAGSSGSDNWVQTNHYVGGDRGADAV
jgi:hypothetical protein